MATQRRTRTTAVAPSHIDRSAVTPDRFARLLKLLELIDGKPMARDVLARKVGLDIRGFYRDLGLLRSAGVDIHLNEGRYQLAGSASQAAQLLPFPDPLLTLGEVQALAKGKSAVHVKVQKQLAEILGSPR